MRPEAALGALFLGYLLVVILPLGWSEQHAGEGLMARERLSPDVVAAVHEGLATAPDQGGKLIKPLKTQEAENSSM